MPGLNTKIAALNILVEASNTKLDTIITMLGGAPPTPTATLDDLLAALIAINTDTTSMDGRLLTSNVTLDDIHTDTTSMDGKLLTVRDTLIDILADTTAMDDILIAIRNILFDPSEDAIEDITPSIAWNLYRLRRAIATPNLPAPEFYPMHNVLASLYSITNSLFAINNAHLGNISDAIFTGADNLGLSLTPDTQTYDGYLFSVLNWLGLISGSTGLPIEANNRDVIQLLAKIADRPESQIGSGLAPNGLCDEPYVSAGMVLVPGVFQAFPSLVFAVFPNPAPAPLSFGTVFGVGVDYTEISITDSNWAGWGAYVASSAPNFGLYIGGDLEASLIRYPTNVWVDLSDFDYNLSFYVGGSDSIRVYLCNSGWGGGSGSGGPWEPLPIPPVVPWTECIEIESTADTYISGTVSGGDNYSQTCHCIIFDGISSIDCGNRHSYGTAYEGFNAACSVFTSDASGVYIYLIAGSTPITVVYVLTSGDRTVQNLNSIDTYMVLPADTASFLICNVAVSSSATHPFTVRICPSEP